MTMMPPRSSATARAARNIFSPMGTLVLKAARMPSEKAMSVAMGIAIPRCMMASAGQARKKMSTGTIIPPQAAMMGSRALSIEESSPTLISRLISNPTERKKMAIKKSLIICPSVMGWPPWLKKLNSPMESATGFCQREK